MLRSVSSFETLYLTRSTSRINDAVNSAINNYVASKSTLGPGEGVNIARVITNELDSAKFDPLLVRTVARNGVKSLEALVSRLDGMVRFRRRSDNTTVSQWKADKNRSCEILRLLHSSGRRLLLLRTSMRNSLAACITAGTT